MPGRDVASDRAGRGGAGLGLSRNQVAFARVVLGLLVGALVAAFAALLLGEYPFSGATPWVAGLLFGYVVAELVVSIGHRRGVLFGVASAVFAAAGLLWAGWISSGDGKQPFPAMAWVAAVLAVLTGLGRAGPKLRRRRG